MSQVGALVKEVKMLRAALEEAQGLGWVEGRQEPARTRASSVSAVDVASTASQVETLRTEVPICSCAITMYSYGLYSYGLYSYGAANGGAHM